MPGARADRALVGRVVIEVALVRGTGAAVSADIAPVSSN